MKFKFELVVAQNSPNVIISLITRFSKVYKSIWNWTDLWLSGVTRFQRFIKIFGIEQICKVIPFKMRNLPEFESRVRFIVIFLFSFCSSWKLNLFSQTGWKFYLERQRDIVANDWNKCLNLNSWGIYPERANSVNARRHSLFWDIRIHSLRKDDILHIFLSTSLWTPD